MSLKFLERDLVNILASMTLKIPHYPDILFKTGYRIEFFEREFNITIDGVSREIKFDLVLNNLDKNHSIPFECKSGHTEPDQLYRYSNLQSTDLVYIGHVTSQKPSMHTHDVTIVINQNNLETVKHEVSEYNFPLLTVSQKPTIISLHGNDFADDDLMTFLQDPIVYPDMIYEVFRIDGQTPEFKYVLLVADALTTLSVRGVGKFSLDELLPSIFETTPGLYPARIGNQLRVTMQKKLDYVLTQGSRYELKDYFYWDNKVKLGYLSKIHPGCKPSIFKGFTEKAKELAERLRLGTDIPNKYLPKKERKSPGQLDMTELINEQGDNKE